MENWYMKGVMIMREKFDVKEWRSLLTPFVVGGVVGAGIALLLAPKSGKELRKDIKHLAENTGGRISATVEKGREIYTEGAVAVKSAIHAGKMAYIGEARKHHRKAA